MADSSTHTWGPSIRLHSTKSPFDSPLAPSHKAFAGVKPVSWKRYNIAGLLLTIYGVQELPKSPRKIVCLWLLHGRGGTQDNEAFTAGALLEAWNSKRRNGNEIGLICVTFDQRNHGSRMIEDLNNLPWKQGNTTHGPDLFNLYCGTARDLSLLITQLPAYIPSRIDEHICGGVSLGGHATWLALMMEPRIRAGLVVIGCADYARLMTDRAIHSKLPSAVGSDPPGTDFLGSKDFPPSLVDAISRYDPAALFSKAQGGQTSKDLKPVSSKAETQRLRALMQQTLAGKRILCVSGGKDKLVPHAQSVPFYTWLKNAINRKNGWCKDMGIAMQDIIDPDARHEFSALMRTEAERWLCDLLSNGGPTTQKQSRL